MAVAVLRGPAVCLVRRNDVEGWTFPLVRSAAESVSGLVESLWYRPGQSVVEVPSSLVYRANHVRSVAPLAVKVAVIRGSDADEPAGAVQPSWTATAYDAAAPHEVALATLSEARLMARGPGASCLHHIG